MRSSDRTYPSLTRATTNLDVSVSGERGASRVASPAIDIDDNRTDFKERGRLCPSRRRRLRRLGNVVLVWSVLVNHGQRAVRIRRERVTRRNVVSGAVDAGSDRQRRHHSTRRVIRHRHQAAAAAAEQPVMAGVDGHRHRLAAWCRRPAARDGRGLRVDFDDLARVGEVRSAGR